jgi:DNA-binding NarL/FixJ family response regulator
MGHAVTVADRGRDALTLLHEQYVDLAVLDLSLPDADGFEILQSIHSEFPSLKVIVTSVFMSSTMRRIAIQLGAVAAVDKVSATGPLVGVVSAALKKASRTYLLKRD